MQGSATSSSNASKFATNIKKGSNQNSFNEGKIPASNNFMASSNLSTFLMNKGSSGSLRTFENEYSYKINLENLNGNGPKTTGNAYQNKNAYH